MMSGPLAPALGRLAAPSRNGPLDPVRLELVDTLVSAGAQAPLDGAVWLAAWQRAMGTIRDQLVAEAVANLERAALRSKFPAGSLAALRPDPETAEALLHRLLAEGEPLERLDGSASDAAVTRARGAALQTGWDAVSRIAAAERAHWSGVARDVAAWRRPWRPLIVAAAVSVSLMATLAAMLGGLLPTPRWFAPVTEWFWSLPWP
jgi:hypothetical protein